MKSLANLSKLKGPTLIWFLSVVCVAGDYFTVIGNGGGECQGWVADSLDEGAVTYAECEALCLSEINCGAFMDYTSPTATSRCYFYFTTQEQCIDASPRLTNTHWSSICDWNQGNNEPPDFQSLSGPAYGGQSCFYRTRTNECWGTCESTAGFCDKCDSESGARGACCKAGDSSDPVECGLVPSGSFSVASADYHQCVIVPGAPPPTAVWWSH